VTTGFRSLADQLRSWPDDRLSRLLRARPDLANPAPHDSGQLAARAATRSSLARALDQLDRCELVVLDALVAAGHTTPQALTAMVNAAPSSVAAALERLEDLALAWRAGSGLRALTGVAEAMGGASLQMFSAEPAPPERIDALLADISPAARAMLEHVADHGGEAQTGRARTTVSVADAATPAEELITRGLLSPRATGTCVVPGEVGLRLRGGRTTAEPVDVPPEVAMSERDQSLVDRTAAGAAFEVVRRVELLLDGWGAAPPSALRSGGLGVRDLKAAAARLHVDEPTAALLIEVAAAAGLVTAGTDHDGDLAWLPTDLFDAWVAGEPAERWVGLAGAWMTMPRMPALVGTRDAQDRAWNALVPELSGVHMAETRRMTLEVLASLPPGCVLATGTGGAGVVSRLAWERPRRPRSRSEQVGWTLAEAAALGLTGLGGLATYARALLAGKDPVPALVGLLPEPVDHVLLQADLTAVAPGPLESSLARRLQVAADVESRGGATVYRFTTGSVRRAMDLGWTAVELHDFVASLSRTPVPQPLTYLIDDTARTFGAVRVGFAEAFLRADDEHALTELLHHPSAASLGLRRLAPTVVISTTPLDVLLPRLREMGAAPVVEAADGSVHVARPDAQRTRMPRDKRSPAAEDARGAARAAAVVTAIRAGDAATAAQAASPATMLTPSGALAALREAIDAGGSVVIGYVDNQGGSSDRVVTPLSVDDGQLRAEDHRTGDIRTFAVARIRTVRPVP
jgi:hypothetical protein